ncbi:MAG: alpha/beta hydrolase [Clostridia bacterium]|nr:alpha/beta hydrolase [Clostridia bacterium]
MKTNAKTKTKKGLLIALISILGVAVIAASAFFIYTGVYYHADGEAIKAYLAEKPTVTKETISGGVEVFRGEEVKAGLIFYPGGKVEYNAYEPLMAAFAERGYLGLLVKMPFNLAVLKPNAASGLREKFPEVTEWYIGGHSLGGSMAAHYASAHAGDFAGLLLLGSYAADDLSGTELDVISVYGSEYRVMKRDKYEASKAYYPEGRFFECVVEGGCHGHFGFYGAQKGDGSPSVDRATQIKVTVDFFTATVGR